MSFRCTSSSSLLSYWESIDVFSGSQILTDLGLSSKSSSLDLAQLSNLLNSELVENEDIRRLVMHIVRISMHYNITRIPGAMAAITTLQHEVVFIRKDLDNIVSERDKLRSDLQVNIIVFSN